MKAITKRRMIPFLLVLVASSLLLVAAMQGPLRRRVEQDFKPGTLPYLAKDLKQKGITKRDLGAPIIPEYPYLVGGLDQLLAESDAVVVATLMDQRYRMSADFERIETIAKFRVDDFLSGTIKRARGQVPAERLLAGAKSLGPLKEDEILVLRGGGTLRIDGILFRQGDYGYPPFAIGRQYVLFLEAWEPRPGPGNHYGDNNVRLYLTSLGPGGVYGIEEQSRFPAKLQSHGLADVDLIKEMEQRFLSRKDFVVDHLRRMGRTPQIHWLEER